MKITNESVIKNGEKELIEAIVGDLDWHTIESVFKEKHQLGIQDDVEYRGGEIVVHNGNVAYKLDYDVKLTLSILFNRSGDCLAVNTSGNGGSGSEQKNVSESESVQTEAEAASRFSYIDEKEAPEEEEPIELSNVIETQTDAAEEELLELTEVVKYAS
jgi:hypothetical protein